MDPLINLVIYVILFAVVAYGIHWVCVQFSLPQPVMWICGGLLLIVLLVFLSHQVGVYPVVPLRR